MNKKFFITAGIISIIVLIMVLVLSSSNTNKNELKTSENSISQLRSSLINLSEEKIKDSQNYRASIIDKLPIYLPKFMTSTGIETSLNIAPHPEDSSLVYFEIFGLSYLNQKELNFVKNPNVLAYKETFLYGLNLLKELGIDYKKLIFVYGDKNYVQTTASYWVDKLGLLR